MENDKEEGNVDADTHLTAQQRHSLEPQQDTETAALRTPWQWLHNSSDMLSLEWTEGGKQTGGDEQMDKGDWPKTVTPVS